MTDNAAGERDPGGGRAFIGSFTSAGGRGVVAADVDRETGALTVTGATDAVADPSFLAPATDRAVLYAVSETEAGAVAAFDTSGPAPRLIGAPVPVRGAGPAHLTIASGHVLTADYGSGGVTVLPLGPDGVPRAATDALRHRGSGPDPDRQAGPHAHQVLPDPSGRWVLSVDLGTDSVRVCALDPATGRLTQHGETALPPGSGPRHLAFHPSGGHVYVLCELEPTLYVCRWDAHTGGLDAVAGTSVLPSGAETAGRYPSGLVVAPDGRCVWAAVRGSDAIAVLRLDGPDEKPFLTSTVPCGGHWPRDLTLDPRGRRLYVANERSGDVTWFALDPATGVPERAGAIAVPAASCVVLV
ncbi:lactonase family protein [Streptomyces sp. SP18CS02]|uniref:lactonase family protein n=1 Tax=Streptomyces sp. SP18CS02 TaxID=3002531 RepID=UPI002E79DA77|nr:lactonase family protein [Streptomyces sp. SP18CS02]MEE1755366.1 lactonase family protein [Streptomyces sp. SP18CS02]